MNGADEGTDVFEEETIPDSEGEETPFYGYKQGPYYGWRSDGSRAGERYAHGARAPCPICPSPEPRSPGPPLVVNRRTRVDRKVPAQETSSSPTSQDARGMVLLENSQGWDGIQQYSGEHDAGNVGRRVPVSPAGHGPRRVRSYLELRPEPDRIDNAEFPIPPANESTDVGAMLAELRATLEHLNSQRFAGLYNRINALDHSQDQLGNTFNAFAEWRPEAVAMLHRHENMIKYCYWVCKSLQRDEDLRNRLHLQERGGFGSLPSQ